MSKVEKIQKSATEEGAQTSEQPKHVKYTTPPEVLEKTGEIKHHTDDDLVDHDDWAEDMWEPEK